MTDRLLTTVVGSYPQPEWLVDRKNLRNRLPPRSDGWDQATRLPDFANKYAVPA